MPRWIRALSVVVPLALVIILATAACENQSPPASSPAQGSVAGARISVDSDTKDFGQVALDKEVRHSFNVTNAGSETLTLRNVSVKVVEGC